MARQTKRLSARTVTTIKAPGLYADGDGLYLRVDASGAKRWALIYFAPDPEAPGKTKRKEMGLGRLADVPLAEAREKATAARRTVAAGADPIAERKAAREGRGAVITFGQEADAYIEAHAPAFRNAKHVYQWGQTLGDGYCRELRKVAVDQISTADVLAVLQPIWLAKSETASRLRGRIERVLDAAKAKGHRTGENPARWRGHLDKLLPRRQKLSRGHHAAMPYADVPAFMGRLRGATGMGALALQFTILTASRTSEVLLAEWPEVDLAKGIWTVPATRMKAGREHRVPLSAPVLAMLKSASETRTSSPYIFPGSRPRRPLSNMTMNKTLGSLGAEAFTVHGFRSSFRDWVSEETAFPSELAEAALAHIVGDEVERAYRRGDVLAKRKKLMDAWAAYCSTATRGNVVPMTRKVQA